MPDPTSPEHWMNIDPPVWETVERYAKQNDEFAAALMSLRARLGHLEAAGGVERSRAVPDGAGLLRQIQSVLGHAFDCDARAVIRCTASWLREHGASAEVSVAELLERQAQS